VVSPYGRYCRDRLADLSTLLATPSLRQLWKMYKALLASGEEFADRSDLVLARNYFCIVGSGILKNQAFLLNRVDMTNWTP
jgi:hypothetical protein